MCAKARVTSYPARAAGTANSSPMAKADDGRAHDGEGVLPDHERETACEEAKDDGAEQTGSSLKRIYPRGHADEEWQSVRCEREQRPTEGAEPNNIEKNADDNHGDGSRDKDCKGRAFHHHHGADPRIADPARFWNPLQSGWRQV